jgi:hypothetical protein
MKKMTECVHCGDTATLEVQGDPACETCGAVCGFELTKTLYHLSIDNEEPDLMEAVKSLSYNVFAPNVFLEFLESCFRMEYAKDLLLESVNTLSFGKTTYCEICWCRNAVIEIQGRKQCFECRSLSLPLTVGRLYGQPELQAAVAGLYFNRCNTQLLATFLEGFWHAEFEEDLWLESAKDPCLESAKDPCLEFEKDPQLEFEKDLQLEFEKDPQLEFEKDPQLEFEKDPQLEFEKDPQLEFKKDLKLESLNALSFGE